MRKPGTRESMAYATIAKMEKELALRKPCTVTSGVYPLLVDRAFYTIHAFTEEEFHSASGEPEGRWRIAWWEAQEESFHDISGDKIMMQDFWRMMVIPTPLPEVIQ